MQWKKRRCYHFIFIMHTTILMANQFHQIACSLKIYDSFFLFHSWHAVPDTMLVLTCQLKTFNDIEMVSLYKNRCCHFRIATVFILLWCLWVECVIVLEAYFSLVNVVLFPIYVPSRKCILLVWLDLKITGFLCKSKRTKKKKKLWHSFDSSFNWDFRKVLVMCCIIQRNLI